MLFNESVEFDSDLAEAEVEPGPRPTRERTDHPNGLNRAIAKALARDLPDIRPTRIDTIGDPRRIAVVFTFPCRTWPASNQSGLVITPRRGCAHVLLPSRPTR
jgi:hypothetical protein